MRFSGKIGEEYDLFEKVDPTYMEMERPLGRLVATLIEDVMEPIVLELGCGTGITTREILDVNDKANVIAVDNEPVMIEQAKLNLRKYGGRVEFVLADMCDVEYEVDVVASAFALHNLHYRRREKLLKNIYQMVRRGFVNADKIASDSFRQHMIDFEWQLKQFEYYDSIGKPELREEWERHYVEDNRPELIQYEAELLRVMRDIGFKAEVKYRKRMGAIVVGK